MKKLKVKRAGQKPPEKKVIPKRKKATMWIAFILGILLLLQLIFILSSCGDMSPPSSSPAGVNEMVRSNAKESMMESEEAAESDLEGQAGDRARSLEAGEGDINLDLVKEEKTLPKKIIYTYELRYELRTREAFDELLADFHKKLDEAGGFVEEANMSGGELVDEDEVYREYIGSNPTGRRADLKLRVPSDKVSDFVKYFQEHYRPRSMEQKSENITTVYYDNKMRVESLEKERDALLEIYDKAESISDILEVKKRISDVEREIQSLTQTLKIQDREVAYATVEVTLQEKTRIDLKSQVNLPFGIRVSESFQEGWTRFVIDMQDLCIYLAGHIFDILFFVVVIWIIVLIIRGISLWSLKRRAKRANRKNKKNKGTSGPGGPFPYGMPGPSNMGWGSAYPSAPPYTVSGTYPAPGQAGGSPMPGTPGGTGMTAAQGGVGPVPGQEASMDQVAQNAQMVQDGQEAQDARAAKDASPSSSASSSTKKKG